MNDSAYTAIRHIQESFEGLCLGGGGGCVCLGEGECFGWLTSVSTLQVFVWHVQGRSNLSVFRVFWFFFFFIEPNP